MTCKFTTSRKRQVKYSNAIRDLYAMNRTILFVFFSSVLLLYSVSSTKSKNEEIRDKVSKFIYYQMTQCKINQEKCKIEQFFDTKVTQVSASWFVFSGWRNEDQEPMGWQGAMFYHHPEHQEHAEDELLSGYYIYPDWTSCIEGLWQFHQLLEGSLCILYNC